MHHPQDCTCDVQHALLIFSLLISEHSGAFTDLASDRSVFNTFPGEQKNIVTGKIGEDPEILSTPPSENITKTIRPEYFYIPFEGEHGKIT